MRSLPLLVRHPVTVQQAVGDLGSDFALRDLFGSLLVAIVIAAIGIDIRGERNPFSIRRPDRPVGPGRNVSNFLNRTGCPFRNLDAPDLRLTVASRYKRQALPVGRPPR